MVEASEKEKRFVFGDIRPTRAAASVTLDAQVASVTLMGEKGATGRRFRGVADLEADGPWMDRLD